MKLKHAELSYNEAGTPQSDAFGDVYYSNDNGLLESEYVFIEANSLLDKWKRCQQAHFTIAETGFGTGLNFLLTLRAFALFRKQHPHSPLLQLHFISFEKYPIKLDELQQILQAWPELELYTKALLQHYPPALSGVHRRCFSQGLEEQSELILDLVLGDAHEGMQQIYSGEFGIVDAWFLDGFAPSKNSSMWEQNVFEEIARLSKNGASLATFTAAGAVKRNLQSVGFKVSKIKGFGRKREMIVASFDDPLDSAPPISKQHINRPRNRFNNQQPPYFHRPALATKALASNLKPVNIAIVGAGIAGAMLALRLCELGANVTLICKDDGAAQGASGNPVGGFYPQLNAEAGINSQFFVHSFLYAHAYYQNLLQRGVSFEHDWCGVLQLGFNSNTALRIEKMAAEKLWPNSLAEVVNAQQASSIAGIDLPYSALHLPQGGWIAPVSLVQACINKAKQSGRLSTLYEHDLVDYKSTKSANGSKVDVSLQHQQTKKALQFDALVLAAGHHSGPLSQQNIPMRLTRGQVEAIPPTTTSAKLNTVLCHKGYFTPQHNGTHALGSTYVKDDLSTDYRESERAQNLQMHQKALAQSPWFSELSTIDEADINGRAAIRCSTPDHLPLIGAMPSIAEQSKSLEDLYKALPAHHYPTSDNVQGVYMLTGLGSRGLTSAPLMVETLASEIMNRPLPMGNTLLNAVQPNRFLVRALVRRQNYP
jgi:tRNA 5-methylaminomethyl-2-thiouridine biosynthesis bifunctional protein